MNSPVTSQPRPRHLGVAAPSGFPNSFTELLLCFWHTDSDLTICLPCLARGPGRVCVRVTWRVCLGPCPAVLILAPSLEHHVELSDQKVDVVSLLGLEGLSDDAGRLSVLLTPKCQPVHFQNHVAHL